MVYILTDGMLALTFGFLLSFLLTGKSIPILIRKQMGQNIREDGPQSHKKKSGTPSMGGCAFIIATVIATIGVAGFHKGEWKNIAICLSGFIAFGLIGFIDDYLKVVKKQNEGLKVKEKFALQFIFALGFAIYMGCFSGYSTDVYIPFVKLYVDFGIFYIPFVCFTILAMTNGVNLTDGLDGLASGVTFIVAGTFAIIAKDLNVSSWVFFSALAGAMLGFLAYNKNPAQLFMGDTGSLALGGGLTTAAFLMKMEFLLAIVGIIYVMETLSVVLQVSYFKVTKGKRLFRMAPLHHHFEEGGMSERAVVSMFWLITFVAAILVKLFA